MTTARFVLRYRGEGTMPAADRSRVHELHQTVVVESTSRMLLVEGDPTMLADLVATLPGWVMAPEQQYDVPDTRRRVDGPPE